MTISTTDALSSGGNLQNYTFSSTDIGVAAENRVVYAMVSARKSGTGASTLLSVTINGVTANIIRQTGAAEAGGYNVMAIVAAAVPTGSSVDVVVGWSTTHARCGGIVATSYDSLPDVVETAEATGTGTITPGLSAVSDGVTLAMALVFSSGEALSPTTGATSLGSVGPESNPRLYVYETTEPFSATTNGSTYTPIVIEATFPAQTLPAIRPYQKTLLHLRDSAQLDFGPARQTLTNNGVTVTDDVLSFASSGAQLTFGDDLSSTTRFFSFWIKAADANRFVLLSPDNSGKIAFVRENGSAASAFTNVTANAIYVNGQYYGTSMTRQQLYDETPAGEWVHLAADLTFIANWNDVRIGPYTFSSGFDFEGEIADFRINDYTLTAGEVFDLYNEGRGFDLPERKQLPDTVVHLLDGSTDAGFHGEEIELDNTTFENGVYTLSGTTPHIDFGQTRVFSESDGFAFACFFNITDMDQRRFLWCHGTATYLELNGATTLRYKASDNTLRFRSYDFTPGQTYHLAVSVEGGVASVYIDGVFDGTIAVSGTSTFSVSQFSMSNATFMFEGDMWDNRMFDRPISAGEVANLYRKGIPSIRRAEVLRIDPARYSGSGDLIDQTGGGNDLTLPSGYTVTGDVIVSDGTADGPDTGVNVASSAGTIAMWLKTTDTSFLIASPVSGQWVGAAEANASAISSGVTNLVTYVDGAVLSSPTRNTLLTALNDGEWHHVAFTGDFASSWSNDVALMQFGGAANWRYTGEIDKVFLSNTEKLTADQIAFLASSREFADPYFEQFGNLGGETLSIQPSRYTGSGDLLDQSGNGNALTIPAGYTVTDGVLVGDGSTSSLSTGLSVTNDAISVGAWVRTTDDRAILMESDSKFFGCFQDGSSSATRNGAMTNAQLYVDGVAGTYTRDELHTVIADGQWHHMAFTADLGGEWANLKFWEFNASYRLDGETDDLRIETGRKWSAEEVELLASARGVQLPNTRDAKLAILPSYDDASNGGTSTIDYSGNQNTGTISGGPTWNTSDNSESGTRSIESTGAGSVSFDDSGLPLGDSARSIVTWVRVDDYSNDTQWFEYGTDATGQRFGIGVRNTDWMVVAINGAAVGTQNTPAAGTWAPVILTYAGNGAAIGTVTFYIDGVAYSASTQAGVGSNVPGTVSGAGALLASIVSGNIEAAIDDVLIYNRVLTPAEIARFSDRRNIFGDAYVAPPPVAGSSIPTANQLTLLGCF